MPGSDLYDWYELTPSALQPTLPVMQEMTASRARNAFPSLQDAAALHEPTVIRRRRGMAAVLISHEDFRAILERCTFSPDVFLEGGTVSIWLPELSIWGRGESFADARADLLDEIDQLLGLLQADVRFRTSPDMVKRLPWVYRLGMVDDDDERLRILFETPPPAELAHP